MRDENLGPQCLALPVKVLSPIEGLMDAHMMKYAATKCSADDVEEDYDLTSSSVSFCSPSPPIPT